MLLLENPRVLTSDLTSSEQFTCNSTSVNDCSVGSTKDLLLDTFEHEYLFYCSNLVWLMVALW